jgi:hypothetical protein
LGFSRSLGACQERRCLKKIDSVNNIKRLTLQKKRSNQESSLDGNEKRRRNAAKEKNFKKNCKEEREKVWRIRINK